MNDWNNTTNEFEFVEQSVAGVSEFDEFAGEFEESVVEGLADRSEVVIFTDTFCIRGKITLVPGARLTDYIVEANSFIAVTEAEVKDKTGNLILTTPFLNINRDRIEIILPANLAVIS